MNERLEYLLLKNKRRLFQQKLLAYLTSKGIPENAINLLSAKEYDEVKNHIDLLIHSDKASVDKKSITTTPERVKYIKTFIPQDDNYVFIDVRLFFPTEPDHGFKKFKNWYHTDTIKFKTADLNKYCKEILDICTDDLCIVNDTFTCFLQFDIIDDPYLNTYELRITILGTLWDLHMRSLLDPIAF